MERFAKGMKVWADTQARLLPALREHTSKPFSGELTPNRAVVLVEPRAHPALEFVIRNLRFCLPTWKLVVVHGTANEKFLKGILASIEGTFEFVNCGVDDLPPPAYNTLFTRPSFWKSLSNVEWVLIAQTDTMLMRAAEQDLEALISKDIRFVGAPWNFSCGVCGGPLDGGCGHMIDQAVVATLAPNMVGNGGLSLRHVPSLLNVLDAYHLDAQPVKEIVAKWGPSPKSARVLQGTTNEDVFFCKALSLMDFQIADRATGLSFAIEQIPPFEWKSEGTLALGAHKPWAYLSDKLVKAIFDRVTFV